MSFDDFDADHMRAQIATFGVDALLTPMTRPSPNGGYVADETRAAAAMRGIRAEPSARFDNTDNGAGRRSTPFKSNLTAQQAELRVIPADVAIAIRVGDRVSYLDRPGMVWEIAERNPDGLSGLALKLTLLDA